MRTAGDLRAIRLETLHCSVEPEQGAAPAAPVGEPFGELEAVAAFFVDEVDAAREGVDARRQRRHQIQAILAIEDAERKAERSLALRYRDRFIQAFLVGVQFERAARDGIVGDARVRPDLLQRLETEQREPQHVPGVRPATAPPPRRA